MSRPCMVLFPKIHQSTHLPRAWSEVWGPFHWNFGSNIFCHGSLGFFREKKGGTKEGWSVEKQGHVYIYIYIYRAYMIYIFFKLIIWIPSSTSRNDRIWAEGNSFEMFHDFGWDMREVLREACHFVFQIYKQKNHSKLGILHTDSKQRMIPNGTSIST